MSQTVVLTVPFTGGITQQEGEKAIIELIERRIRDSFVAVAEEASTLHTTMRGMAAREIDGEETQTILRALDSAIVALHRRRTDIENRLDARASLIERVDGSPVLEIVRAS